MKPDYQDKGINFYNCDCMTLLKEKPDNYWNLAIIDPPYGEGQHFNFRFGENVYNNCKPAIDYWSELFRISINQIVWGGNYFTDNLPVNRCWISWYKGQPINSFSDFELAWTSFDLVSKGVKIESYGFNHADKRNTGQSTIHPTQKPIQLYRWLLQNYAKAGQRILDTHGGSGSSAIACAMEGFEMDYCEIDREYFDASIKRFKESTCQMKLFK